MLTKIVIHHQTLPSWKLYPRGRRGHVSHCPLVALGTVYCLVGVTVACVPGEQSERMIAVKVETPGQLLVTGHQDPGVLVRLQEIVSTLQQGHIVGVMVDIWQVSHQHIVMLRVKIVEMFLVYQVSERIATPLNPCYDMICSYFSSILNSLQK